MLPKARYMRSRGVHKLAKATGAGINAEAKTYWVTADKNCTATVGNNSCLVRQHRTLLRAW